jgi:hypothetical protein
MSLGHHVRKLRAKSKQRRLKFYLHNGNRRRGTPIVVRNPVSLAALSRDGGIPAGAISGLQKDWRRELLVIYLCLTLCFLMGFACGYGVRAVVSRQRRARARKNTAWAKARFVRRTWREPDRYEGRYCQREKLSGRRGQISRGQTHGTFSRCRTSTNGRRHSLPPSVRSAMSNFCSAGGGSWPAAEVSAVAALQERINLVDFHLDNAREKLGAATRTHTISIAA